MTYSRAFHPAPLIDHQVTWDGFFFVNNIPGGEAKRTESLIQTFYETSAAISLD